MRATKITMNHLTGLDNAFVTVPLGFFDPALGRIEAAFVLRPSDLAGCKTPRFTAVRPVLPAARRAILTGATCLPSLPVVRTYALVNSMRYAETFGSLTSPKPLHKSLHKRLRAQKIMQ
jgi:hypothetical protein